jgi:hypothetical protein
MDVLSIFLYAAAVFALAVICIFATAFVIHTVHRAGRRSIRHRGEGFAEGVGAGSTEL